MTPIAQTGSRRLRSALVFSLRCLLAAVLIDWLIRSRRLDLSVLASVRAGWPLATVLFFEAAQMLIPLCRWFLLVRARRLNMPFGTAIHVGLTGSFITIFIPAALGLDAAKIYYGTRVNKGREHDVLSTVLLDRAIGIAALIVLTLVFGYALLSQHFNLALQRVLYFSAGLLIVSSLLGVALLSRHPAALLARLGVPRMAAATLSAISDYRQQKAVVAGAFALSCVGHLANFTGAYFVFQCLGLSTSVLAVFAILPVVTLSSVLPLTPLGLGVTDSVALALFTAVGVRGGAEITTVLRCVIVLLSALCFPAYLLPFPAAAAGNLDHSGAPAVASRRELEAKELAVRERRLAADSE